MTSVPIDRIGAQARQVRFGRALLVAFAAVLFVLGWLPGRLVFAFAWCLVAVRVGWSDGMKRSPRAG